MASTRSSMVDEDNNDRMTYKSPIVGKDEGGERGEIVDVKGIAGGVSGVNDELDGLEREN